MVKVQSPVYCVCYTEKTCHDYGLDTLDFKNCSHEWSSLFFNECMYTSFMPMTSPCYKAQL